MNTSMLPGGQVSFSKCSFYTHFNHMLWLHMKVVCAWSLVSIPSSTQQQRPSLVHPKL